MNREIKFRVWDEDLKEMDEVFEFMWENEESPRMINGSYALGQCPIMQYTGLKDKNGKEIYEGDKCLAALPRERFPIEVIWEECKAGFLFQWNDDTYESGKDEMEIDLFTDIEVIGNIYEK